MRLPHGTATILTSIPAVISGQSDQRILVLEILRYSNMKIYLLLIPISLGLIIAVAALSLFYGFLAHNMLTLRYIFPFNFIVAAALIAIGVALNFVPAAFLSKGSKFLDHSTFVGRSFETRENRQRNARAVLWMGIYSFLLTGLIQILLSLII